MLVYLKSKFAKNRWEVRRLAHLGPRGAYVSETQIELRNRYSYKIKSITRKGAWAADDFPGNTYRG